jgi:hypothetical protein
VRDENVLARIRGGWNRFWFAPSSAESLGICRVLFFAGVLYFGWRDYSPLGAVGDVFWKPIWWFRFLHFPKPSVETLVAIQTAWRIALAASCLGLLTRVSTAISFALGTYLLALAYCFGGCGHAWLLVFWAMAAMALSRCGDAISLDRLLRGGAGRTPAPSGEYRWPIRIVWVAMACAFFGAGLSKLRHAGLDWILSDRLAIFLVQANYPLVRNADLPMLDWGLWIASHRWLSRALALGTVAVETLFPLALVSRRLRPFLVAGALAMQLGIQFVMGPDFDIFIWSYLFWIPWDRVLGWLRERRDVRSAAPAASPALR